TAPGPRSPRNPRAAVRTRGRSPGSAPRPGARAGGRTGPAPPRSRRGRGNKKSLARRATPCSIMRRVPRDFQKILQSNMPEVFQDLRGGPGAVEGVEMDPRRAAGQERLALARGVIDAGADHGLGVVLDGLQDVQERPGDLGAAERGEFLDLPDVR